MQYQPTFWGFQGLQKFAHQIWSKKGRKSASEENVTVFPTYYITKPFEPDINQLPTTFRGFKSSHTRFDHKKADFCHIRPISADIGLGQNFYYFLGTWEMITFRKWHLRLSGASKFRTLDLIQKGPKIGQFRPILASEENLTIFLAYYMTRPFERDMNQLPVTFRRFKISHTRF